MWWNDLKHVNYSVRICADGWLSPSYSAAVLCCMCHCQQASNWTDDLCPHTEREVAVLRWLWYAWQTLRSTPRSTSQRPPGIITQLGQTNAAPGTTIYWHTKGTVGHTGHRKNTILTFFQHQSELSIKLQQWLWNVCWHRAAQSSNRRIDVLNNIKTGADISLNTKTKGHMKTRAIKKP